MSERKRSYIVRRGAPLSPLHVDCTSVEFRDGAVLFLDADHMPLCAFSSWESIEVVSQVTGKGNGWVVLKVTR